MTQPALPASLLMLQALASYIDQGSGNATLIFFDDERPANVSMAFQNSAKVLSMTFPKPCIKAVHAANIELHAPAAGVAVKTGTVKWARMINGAGQPVLDVAMGADIVLDKYDLVIGSSVKLDAMYLSPSI